MKNNLKNSEHYFRLGAVLYMPGNHQNLKNIINNSKIEYTSINSLVMDLEDALDNEYLDMAYANITALIPNLLESNKYIFIRIKDEQDIDRLQLKNPIIHNGNRYENILEIISGVVVPKINLERIDKIFTKLEKLNIKFVMPIIESNYELNELKEMKKHIQNKYKEINNKILCIRIGSTDILSEYHLRRNKKNIIYDFLHIKNAISNILNVFSKDYNISGTVYEYFDDDMTTLSNEIEMDILNGMYAKTTIHPKQVYHINENYKVTQKDVNSANTILNPNITAVSKSIDNDRMEEKLPHFNWAKVIKLREEIYGIQQ